MDGTRAHARNESVARMRVPHTVRQSPTKARTSPALGPDSPANTPVLDALQFIDQRRRRSVLVKLLAAGTLIVGSLWLMYGFVEGQRVGRLVGERKHNLVGGESHILPQRWREQGVGNKIDGEVLPDCQRVMLFKFRSVTSGRMRGGGHQMNEHLAAQSLTLTLFVTATTAASALN
jgi:hypothetical protein